jgi:DNA-binding beta-propeller fold protein YncE
MMRRIQASVVLVIAFVIAATATRRVVGQSGSATAPKQAGARPTFQVDPTWPKLPNNWVMGDPSSVAVDRHDNVWVLHRPRTVPDDRKDRAAPPVIEFDAAGRFVQAWGGPNDAYEWPDTEHGIYVDYKDNVWIGGNNPVAQLRLTTRSDDMLLKFTSKGKLVKQIGHRDQSGGNKDTNNLKEPADVVVYQKTNEAFVADGYGNRRVIVLDADTGAFKRMWGAFGNTPLDPPPPAPAPTRGTGPAAAPPRQTEGPGPQQFGIVHSVKVSNDGLVYVADRGNSRVQVFTLDGKYVTQAFVNRTAPSATTACGLALSPDPQQQFLYVSDFGNGHMVVLNRKTLEVVTQFGERSKEPGDFQNAHHIATDSKGNLYTAEVNPGSRVQKFLFKGMARTSTSQGQ